MAKYLWMHLASPSLERKKIKGGMAPLGVGGTDPLILFSPMTSNIGEICQK